MINVYDSSSRKPRKYTDEIDELLDEILENEIEKCKLLGTNKQKLNRVQIHHAIVEAGYDISLSTISNKVREKRKKPKECLIKQSYDLGDRLEYDFGEVKLLIDGELGNYHIAVLSSPGANEISIDISHYLNSLTKKPEALFFIENKAVIL